MSFNLRNIREVSNSPNDKFISHLAKKISDFANAQQTQDLENKEDIYSAGQDVESVLKLHSLNSSKRFEFNLPYFPPLEPDLSNLRLWIRGINLGNRISEISGFNRVNSIEGDPILIDGTPHDDGIHTGGTKSTALRFNRPGSSSENQDYIILDMTGTTSMNILNAGSPGKSYFMRFRVSSLAQQDGSDRRLFEMTDDATPNNGIVVKLTTSGKVNVQIVKGGTNTVRETPSSTILVDTVYDLWITYTISGNDIDVYVNGVDQTLTTPSATNWHQDLSNTNMYIFRRGAGTDEGYVSGDLYDFRIYDGKVVNYNAIGTSVSFDGTNDSIDLTNDASLWSQSLTKFSVNVWVYPEVAFDGTARDIFRHGGSGGGRFNCQADSATANRVNFIVRNAADTTNFTATSNSLFTLNNWHMVTCVYDNSLGSANLKIYVDGVVGGNTANLTDALNLSATFTLGGPSTDLDGYMRDFRWWTTKALTQTEVTQLYNKSLSSPLPNYWLNLTYGSGSPLDAITGTKTAALTNGTAWVNSEIGNHYINKWTVTGIPFGQVMITDYYATYG